MFNTLINNADDTEDTLSKSADDIKLVGASDVVKCRASNQRGLEKFEDQAHRNLKKFNNGKKACIWGGPTQHIGLGSGETARVAVLLKKLKRDL